MSAAWRRWCGRAAVLACASVAAWLVPAAACSAAPNALLVFLPAHEDPAYSVAPPGGYKPGATERLVDTLAAEPALSLALLSTTQGGYTPQQAVLDIGQGTRTAPSAYGSDPPPLALAADGTISGWPRARSRAAGALQSVEPGLLASSIPGGAGYVGAGGGQHLDAVAAADRSGRVAAVSLGSPATVAARAAALLRSRRLVVADLPADAPGASQLAALVRLGVPLVVVQRPPGSGAPVVPVAVTVGHPAGSLSSGTTHLGGLVAAIDIAPTLLRTLRLKTPPAMSGQPIFASGKRDPRALLSLKARLGAIAGRRMPTLLLMLVAAAALCLGSGAVRGWQRARSTALRTAALSFLWLPVAVLIPAALRPGTGTLESLIVAAACLLLAAASDRLLRWPRAPLVPAVATFVALATVLASGSSLLATSVLGPDPSFGARFFGVGNELKSGLTVLALVGCAAAVDGRIGGRRLAGAFLAVGIALAVLLGSGRLGAGVGGVVIVAAGTAGALLTLRERRTTRALALAALSLPAAIVALAALDLATAGGQGHLSHDVLRGGSGSGVVDAIVRRYRIAFGAYTHGMPVATGLALLAAAFGLRNRWLFERPAGPAWRAALAGGLAGGAVGALTEDSGPLLLVVAVFTLAWVTVYLRARPDVALAARTPAAPP